MSRAPIPFPPISVDVAREDCIARGVAEGAT
jgi:hypothetical protein